MRIDCPRLQYKNKSNNLSPQCDEQRVLSDGQRVAASVDSTVTVLPKKQYAFLVERPATVLFTMRSSVFVYVLVVTAKAVVYARVSYNSTDGVDV
ncbi:Hypothetical protein CINCED_3A014454 [Cinara cedri]|uniref:Uncharacterized protein n=1 Tax=Cinara cedri TaxID=506608 RepID=A0A5E4NE19_9HEMI|nr:Hypothetical protein CINCED_3A014454 [Cinara cedri]